MVAQTNVCAYGKVPGFNPYRFNRVKGQPFVVARLVEEFTKILEA